MRYSESREKKPAKYYHLQGKMSNAQAGKIKEFLIKFFNRLPSTGFLRQAQDER